MSRRSPNRAYSASTTSSSVTSSSDRTPSPPSSAVSPAQPGWPIWTRLPSGSVIRTGDTLFTKEPLDARAVFEEIAR